MGSDLSLYDSLMENSAEQTLQQLIFIEGRLAGDREAAQVPALFDEVYRAAQGLRSVGEPPVSPGVARLGRMLQEVVRMTRAGRLEAKPELVALLASITRIARESLEASMKGLEEPPSVSSANALLADLVARPAALEEAAWEGADPGPVAHVDARRLRDVAALSKQTRSAADAIAASVDGVAQLASRYRELTSLQEKAALGLRESIPRVLASAARGEPTTEMAAEVFALIASLSGSSGDFADRLDEKAEEARRAAESGTRLLVDVGTALSRLHRLPLASVLEDFPRKARRAALSGGTTVDLVIDTGDAEIGAGSIDLMNAVLNGCLHALFPPTLPLIHGSGRSHPPKATLSLESYEEAGNLYVRLTLEGEAPKEDSIEKSLVATRKRLLKSGGSVELEWKERRCRCLLVTLPTTGPKTEPSEEFLIVKAGAVLRAIPARLVVECIEAGSKREGYSLDGTRIRTRRLGGSLRSGPGVVVRNEAGAALLLVDSVEGREILARRMMEGSDGKRRAAAIRRDGSCIPLVDVAEITAPAGTSKGASRRGAAGSRRDRKRHA